MNKFDEFWSICRRKVKKGYARKAYAKALKIADHDTIMAGMKRSVEYWDSQGTQTQFIPHPSTWLNGECWEDEYETAEVIDIFTRANLNG